jgi:raffinose/stachyose/melibiose transport system permease protein
MMAQVIKLNPKKKLGKKASERLWFWLFLAPALGAFAIMVWVPFFMGVYFSMTDWTGLNTGRQILIGFENYRTIFTDYRFIYSFSRTVIYSVLNILVINGVAFGLSLLVTQKFKLKNVYRAAFFIPNLIGGLVLGFIWQFIFNNIIAGQVGLQLLERSPLSSSPNDAMFALIAVVTWQYAGYIMMIYIAALQNIPEDLIEASKIDGANAVQRMRAIVLPLVAQAFTVALFLTLVTSFKQFDTVQSLTNSGPATDLPLYIRNLLNITTIPTVSGTSLMAVDIYREAFTRFNMGVGQAKAIVFFAVLLLISITQVYVNKKREVEL